MAPPPPVTTITCPVRIFGCRAFELGLLERPVFEIEQLVMAQRPELTDRLGTDDRFDPHFCAIGGNFRIL